MKSISGKAFCKIVEKQGWVLERISSSHHIYAKDSVQAILSIPVHGNRDLPIGTFTKLSKDGNLTEDDLKK